jgi:hypothetical protein
MIDIHLLVYAGTLALFIICFLAVGVLSVIVFTALATINGIAREHRNKQTRQEYADVQGPANLITAEAFWIEEDEARSLTAEKEQARTGHGPIGKLARAVRRPGLPQMIHHR